MKITLARAELRTMATGFARIVPGKSSIPVLGCVRLDVRPDGLVAHATDLDQSASYRFERPALEGVGSLVLPFQLLRDYAKGAPAERITLTSDDGRTVFATNPVGGHAVTTTLLCASPADWPADVDADAGDIPTSQADGFLPRSAASRASRASTPPARCSAGFTSIPAAAATATPRSSPPTAGA